MMYGVAHCPNCVSLVVDVDLSSPPPRCDERWNESLPVEVAHLLIPQCLLGSLLWAVVRSVVLVDDCRYWVAWLIAYNLHDGLR